MSARRSRFLLLGLGVIATMIFLIVVGMRGQQGLAYYLTVQEFVAHGATQGDHFRVNGKVDQGTIERLPGGRQVRFVMSDGQASLKVDFEGIIPDTFVDGADVVVEGSLGDDGVFRATTLLAKCPSKYESADGAKDKA